MNIKLIKTKKDYQEVSNRIDEIWNNPKKIDELEILSILIEKYENEYYKIDNPDPIEAIKFRMDQKKN